jgi:hypothetical protein
MNDPLLEKIIRAEITALETEQEIVVCAANSSLVTRRLCEAVLGVVPRTGLSPLELYAVRRLIFQAVNSPGFFDWEMPTLTGATAEEFRAIANKLPRD